VLDTGPLVALFSERDVDHAAAVRGFEQLHQTRTRLITPLPITLEVFRWFIYRLGARAARDYLTRMRRAVEIEYPTAVDFDEVVALVRSMPTWEGSLEDAMEARMARTLQAPVLTLNYRDFGAFYRFEFWAPA
jgi:predicted nucleic acid-binding protein